jgi:hypothetical protein
MTEKKENDQPSKELLEKLLTELRDKEAPGVYVDTDGDLTRVRHMYGSDFGQLVVNFYPEQGLTKWALTEAKAIIKSVTLEVLSRMEEEGRVRRVSEQKPTPETETTNESDENLAALLAQIYLEGVHDKISMALYELSEEALFITEEFCRSVIAKSGPLDGRPVEMPAAKGRLKTLARNLSAEREAFLKASINQLAPKFRKEALREEYKRLLPIWQDAKNFYEQNRRRANWKDLVAAAITEEQLPLDLIGRLSGQLLDVPEEMQAKWSKAGGRATPSDIALEHASRACGAAEYGRTIRRLYQLREDTKKGASETLH